VDDRLNRHDLTDGEWQRLLPMMPADARQGHRWSDDQRDHVPDPDRLPVGDLPGEYGNWKTLLNRHRHWLEVWLRARVRLGAAALRTPADRPCG
jgi:transposase